MVRRATPRKLDIYITFPTDGGWQSVGSGETTIDLVDGTVYLPDGTTESTSTSLGAAGFGYAKSILVEATKTIKIGLDTGGKFTIKEGEFIPIVNQQFKRAYITTTETTSVRFWASTNPAGIPSKVSIPQITDLTAGTPVSKLGRYSGSDSTYQTLVSWTVAAGKVGVLNEVAMACADTTSYTNARFRLTVAGSVQWADKQTDMGVSFPFPNNKLDAGTVVLLEVKSVSGAITANGTITGKEV